MLKEGIGEYLNYCKTTMGLCVCVCVCVRACVRVCHQNGSVEPHGCLRQTASHT